MIEIRNKIAGMIGDFQSAIIDLSELSVMESEAGAEKGDIENTQYIIGMAQISAINLAKISELSDDGIKENITDIQNILLRLSVFAEMCRNIKNDIGLFDIQAEKSSARPGN